MFLKKININNFRSFENETFKFDRFLTIIVGKNSLGKTNLLEAVYFLINGIGFRETKEEELMTFGKKSVIIEGSVGLEDETSYQYAIKASIVGGHVNKSYYLNKTEKKHNQYLSQQLKAVLFSPEQINIIIGSPQLRRDYFNKTLSVFNYEYKKFLSNYEGALRKRNKVLEMKVPVERLKEELKFWDDYLIQQGEYLTRKREAYLDFLNENKKLDSKIFSIKYLKNEINRKRLDETLEESLKYRKTVIGPQKDDFQIFVNNENVHHFGSRSEQRLAIFWLKLNELKYFEKNLDYKPIILLDDIFSELDDKNQTIIIDLIQNYQTVATTTEENLVESISKQKTIIHL